MSRKFLLSAAFALCAATASAGDNPFIGYSYDEPYNVVETIKTNCKGDQRCVGLALDLYRANHPERRREILISNCSLAGLMGDEAGEKKQCAEAMADQKMRGIKAPRP